MIALNSDPATALKALISAKVGTTKVYVNNETPSAGWPDEFIEIMLNGPVGSIGSQLGVGDGVLSVSVNVKLLSNDARNYVKENIILGQFQSIFDGAKSQSGFTFSLDKRKMVFQGKSIVSGYSSKILNVNFKI